MNLRDQLETNYKAMLKQHAEWEAKRKALYDETVQQCLNWLETHLGVTDEHFTIKISGIDDESSWFDDDDGWSLNVWITPNGYRTLVFFEKPIVSFLTADNIFVRDGSRTITDHSKAAELLKEWLTDPHKWTEDIEKTSAEPETAKEPTNYYEEAVKAFKWGGFDRAMAAALIEIAGNWPKEY